MAQVQPPQAQPEPEPAGSYDLSQLALDLVAGKIEPAEAVAMMQQQKGNWRFRLSEEQRQLLNACRVIQKNNLVGLPGHGLIMLVAAMADVMDSMETRQP